MPIAYPLAVLPLPTMAEAEQTYLNKKILRRALRAWDSLNKLGTHPLIELGIVQTRVREAGYSDSTAGRGLALRDQLQSALDALKPTAADPDLSDKRWRPLHYFAATISTRSSAGLGR